jgi:hypothetical protein
MENVGIYTPPKKTRPVVSSGSDVFIASLTQNELEVTQSAQDKLHEIISQTDEDVSAIRIYIRLPCNSTVLRSWSMWLH